MMLSDDALYFGGKACGKGRIEDLPALPEVSSQPLLCQLGLECFLERPLLTLPPPEYPPYFSPVAGSPAPDTFADETLHLDTRTSSHQAPPSFKNGKHATVGAEPTTVWPKKKESGTSKKWIFGSRIPNDFKPVLSLSGPHCLGTAAAEQATHSLRQAGPPTSEWSDLHLGRTGALRWADMSPDSGEDTDANLTPRAFVCSPLSAASTSLFAADSNASASSPSHAHGDTPAVDSTASAGSPRSCTWEHSLKKKPRNRRGGRRRRCKTDLTSRQEAATNTAEETGDSASDGQLGDAAIASSKAYLEATAVDEQIPPLEPALDWDPGRDDLRTDAPLVDLDSDPGSNSLRTEQWNDHWENKLAQQWRDQWGSRWGEQWGEEWVDQWADQWGDQWGEQWADQWEDHWGDQWREDWGEHWVEDEKCADQCEDWFGRWSEDHWREQSEDYVRASNRKGRWRDPPGSDWRRGEGKQGSYAVSEVKLPTPSLEQDSVGSSAAPCPSNDEGLAQFAGASPAAEGMDTTECTSVAEHHEVELLKNPDVIQTSSEDTDSGPITELIPTSSADDESGSDAPGVKVQTEQASVSTRPFQSRQSARRRVPQSRPEKCTKPRKGLPQAPKTTVRVHKPLHKQPMSIHSCAALAHSKIRSLGSSIYQSPRLLMLLLFALLIYGGQIFIGVDRSSEDFSSSPVREVYERSRVAPDDFMLHSRTRGMSPCMCHHPP